MDQQYKVLSAYEFKSGVSNKNGKSIPWKIYKATLEGYNGEVSGFGIVNPGDMVTLVEKQNGDYVNTNFVKVKPGGTQNQTQASQPQQSTAGDPRIVKLLTVIAEQIGVPQNTLLDILQRKV